MKTPKEIYLLQKGSQLLGTWSATPQMEISGGSYSAEYKYIRADLVELEAAKKAKTDLAQDWKPSKEQMKALKEQTSWLSKKNPLHSLYYQLCECYEIH